MRVVTCNLHGGVDGWGRPTGALAHVLALNADVLVCPETWRGDDGEDQFTRVLADPDLRGHFVPLARAERAVTERAGRGWQPLTAHLTGEHGLYFTEHRDLSRWQRMRRRTTRLEPGAWGLALYTRLEVEAMRDVALPRQPRERVRRGLIIADLRDGDRPLRVIAVHGPHLSHGSFRTYRDVRRIAEQTEPPRPTLLVGDFNSWRPPLRVFFPGWRSTARARTWPARHPHSQIDHILARGPWRVRDAGATNGGSDHRALRVDLDWPPSDDLDAGALG